MRRFDLPGRSPVMAANAMVATSHPLASASALSVLREGGNAADAAIAAAAVLAVVEPQMTGIGGDCFVILSEPNGAVHALDGSGRAAAGADAAWYRDNGYTDIPEHSAHSVTVPGAVKAWETLRDRFGSFPLERLYSDAIGHAENGFAVAPRVAFDWQRQVATLGVDEGSQRFLLPGGKAPVAGDRFALPQLGQTLRRIANEGSDAFYQGEIAAEIASILQAKGGFLTVDDLGAVTADWVEPVGTDYNAHRLLELPPAGQGIIALILVNMFDVLDIRSAKTPSERFHLEIEAARFAYGVRDAMLADRDHMTVPVEELVSRRYAETLAAGVNRDKCNSSVTIPDVTDSNTIYLSVVDRDGMAVSLINSIYGSFGAQIMAPKSGVVLQNRGNCFRIEEGHPNAIAPGKRPMHTIIPAMVMKGGLPSISFGVMGGGYQPMGHAHVLSNLTDHGMDPQEALDDARIFWGKDGILRAEAGVDAATIAELEAKGHRVMPAEVPWGGGQVIVIDRERGFYVAGSDPRKDGLAIGY